MNDRGGDVLVLEQVRRSFSQGAAKLEVLRGVSLGVKRGELVALVGPSGCGKSTLLHIAGLLERADGGEIRIGGQNGAALADDQRSPRTGPEGAETAMSEQRLDGIETQWSLVRRAHAGGDPASAAQAPALRAAPAVGGSRLRAP